MSLFERLNTPQSPDPGSGNTTSPLSVSPVQDPSQKPTADTAAQIADAVKALDAAPPRMRPFMEPEPVGGTPPMSPPPGSVDLALVPVPEGAYVAGYAPSGKPILRDKITKLIVKGSGGLPGGGKGRAPGLAKMVRDIVHVPGIISFLQDVAIGKLAAGAKMADRIKAAEILLDRGYGKPTQHVELKDETAKSEVRKAVETMSTEKLAETVERLRNLVAQKVATDADIVE